MGGKNNGRISTGISSLEVMRSTAIPERTMGNSFSLRQLPREGAGY